MLTVLREVMEQLAILVFRAGNAVLVLFSGILLLTFAGCSPKNSPGRNTVSVAAFLELQGGTSLEDVRSALQTTGKHQFTALVDNTEYLCLYYLFKEPPVGFYLVFTNEHLQRIIQPPKAEFKRVPYKGTFREIPIQKATTNLIDEVLTARDLTREEISQLIRHALPRSSESLNALPAFMVAAPSFVKGWGEIESDYQTNAELAQKYDPMKVEIGDTVAEVEALFGPPYRIVESSPGSEIHVFGGPVNLRINPAYKFSSVAVVFKNGKVTQVLSHYFFDKQLL